MIVREIKQHELRDQDFTEERHNTFFLSELQEVKLRTRENTTQHRTYVSEQDYFRLSPKQQAAYGANGLNPKLFYCAGKGVAHAPTTRAAKAAKAATKKARRHYSGSRVGIGGRPFSWESEVGEFIVMELSSHSDYLVKQTGSGVQAYERRTNRRMDKDSLLALRSKFELERGDAGAACVRTTNAVKLVKTEEDTEPKRGIEGLVFDDGFVSITHEEWQDRFPLVENASGDIQCDSSEVPSELDSEYLWTEVQVDEGFAVYSGSCSINRYCHYISTVPVSGDLRIPAPC